MEKILNVEQIIEAGIKVTDGYHTFDELYEHRITLYIALCKMMKEYDYVWRSRYHSDGKLCFGTGMQYVLGIGTVAGKQITYHIPMERWKESDFFADTLDKAPEWDGHNSTDVLNRLKNL